MLENQILGGEQLQKSGTGGFFHCALSLRILDSNRFQLLGPLNSKVQIPRPALGLYAFSVVLVKMENQFEGLIVSGEGRMDVVVGTIVPQGILALTASNYEQVMLHDNEELKLQIKLRLQTS